MGAAASIEKASLSSATPADIATFLASLDGTTLATCAVAIQDLHTQPRFVPIFGVVGALKTNDAEKVLPIQHQEGVEQVRDEPLAMAFDVWGVDPDSRLMWLATYNDQKSYFHTDHTERKNRNESIKVLMGTMPSGNPMEDMAGGYMGEMFHCESAPSGTQVGLYALLNVFTAKDATSARILAELLKVTCGRDVHAGVLVRATIVPPGGMQPGGDSEDSLRTVMLFRTVKGRPEEGPVPLGDEVAALCESSKLTIFEAAQHNARDAGEGPDPTGGVKGE
ncbi:hypothetical protein TeGR_g7724 [Tetraparma gracilis]|uniref:Uncharacterized protein n=1 Tax=Tetraparma gracilis TaxID=2962635 RepID=A0ABQ6N6W1_9STRA|nr:hypothetical protein TeGR_g7724 [Tetraparma gracilis]